jgi:hypothetical protein
MPNDHGLRRCKCGRFMLQRELVEIAGQQALPQATIRRQAGSYRGMPSCICRSLPASDSCRSTGLASGNDSPAGRLLQGECHLVFVGACLQAIRAGQPALPQATIRRQARSYRGAPSCFCRSLPASDSCRATGPTSGKDSPAGRLLQGECHLVFVGACLQAIRAGQQALPQATIRRQAGSYKGNAILYL